jgi:hypothetical protein
MTTPWASAGAPYTAIIGCVLVLTPGILPA